VSATLYQDTQGESDPDATYYSYDIMGNVKTLVQHSKMLVAVDNANGDKRIDYEYDLISGKVNKVIYQPGKGDQFIHRYDYDADNRIVNVNTSRDGLIWQNDAKYIYHLHGPLARTELGDLKVQGIDYAYTLQGWLKGVNSSSMGDPQFDIGQDGKTGGTMPIVARDAFGYMLDYYRGDYKPIGQQTYNINSLTSPASVIPLGYRDLFNGNIAGMLTNIRQLNEPMYYGYTYDQLNRIKSMDAYRGQDPQTNTWSSPVHTLDYQERISYDPNGNIKTYLRNGKAPTAMDNLTYNYTPNTNKLRQVLDAVADGSYTEDIDGQPLADNYTYDRIGNMKADNAGGIASITWTVYGKIKRITKSNNDVIEYRYDAAGSRTSKAVSVGNTTTTTYYVRDAQGNVMAVYEKQAANPLKWTEQHLYGSSRLGMWTFGETIPGATTAPTAGGSLEDGYIYGKKFFELNNHLGNVLATVSDKKIGIEKGSTGTTDYFQPEVVTSQDYYPFGMQMPGRKYTKPNSDYRYGFNGKEDDNEVKGEGNQIAFEQRIYDSRLAKFLSIDPIADKYPWMNPYGFAANSPIMLVDVLGMGPGDPVKHTVVKGDNLSRIARKYGTSIKDLMQLNNIKDRNGIIKPGQILTVNPEADFTNNPRGGYRNHDNAEGKEVTISSISKVGINFIRGRGEENSIVVGGKALESVKNWAEVSTRVDELVKRVFADGKAHPGEAYSNVFEAGSLSMNVVKGILEAMDDYNQGKDIWKNNSQNSPIHVIGSFGISIRVNANGTTATIAVYDRKSIGSFSDNKLDENSNRKRKDYPMPYLTNTYQRYLWNISL